MEQRVEPKKLRSDKLIEEVRRLLKMYDEGAETSPGACLHILVALANWEKEICDEHDELTKQLDEEPLKLGIGRMREMNLDENKR